jgi:interferon-induced GTP-binding protein Mx1
MSFHSSKQERHPIESREDVATVISRLTTDSLCKERDFSDSSIVITIEAPDVPDLTLIDLPGIVRTTTSGQSKDVISMVDNLINKYLQHRRSGPLCWR